MSTDIPVIRTRIIPPRRRSDLLTRSRLLEILSELLEKKLSIIAAPAGYGKTSLLIDFVNSTTFPVCWYSIDTMDRDLYRFLTYFISAIQKQFPEFGYHSLASLQNSSPENLNIEHLSTTIVNDAYETISEHFVIVLDDYHLVNGTPGVEQFISRFIQDVDENCHLIISSRTLLTLPDFPLMVARSQVGGLSFEELSFQAEEIQALFQQNYQTSLSSQISEEWYNQTEGWITGLLLSTQMLQNKIPDKKRTAQASGVGLTEYLQSIMNRQPPELQDFLLRSSLLEEFNAELCETVIGQAISLPHQNWQRMMDEILKNNLFVLPVGEDGNWLRYHHLFSDFLQNQIKISHPKEAKQIQLQLAEEYTKNQDWEKAYNTLIGLENKENVAQLIEKSGPNLIARGRIKILEEWLKQLPSEIRVSRPALISIQGMVALSNSEFRKSLRLLNQAIKALSNDNDLEQYTRALVRRSVTYRFLGNHQAALEDAEETLEKTDGHPALLTIRAEALRSKGVCYYQQGKLRDALEWLTQSLEAYQLLGSKENEAILLMETGLIHQSLANYAEAEDNYQQALSHWKSTENLTWLTNVMNNLGTLQHQKGAYEAASNTLESALEYSKVVASPRLEAYALADIGDLYRDLHAANEAIKAYRQSYVIAQRIGDQLLMIYLDLAEANLARIQKRYAQAQDRLSTAWQMSHENEAFFEQCLCYFETGSLSICLKDNEKAIRNLEEAVKNFEKDSHMLEAARAHLYLSIPYFLEKNIDNAIEHLLKAFAITQKNQQPLIVSGYWFKDDFLRMRKNSKIGPLIKNYLSKIEKYEEDLPELRRNLRQQASVIPFAPPKLLIRALGASQVRLNEKSITISDWQTQNARDLFFILLAHPEGLSKEAIGVMFWPDITPEDLKYRFKNTIYRLRRAIGKETILFDDELYRFNKSLDYEYDVEAFLREINFAKFAKSKTKKIEHYQNAFQYYKGIYLPDHDDTWVIAERERLSSLHTNVLLDLAESYYEDGTFEMALKYSQQALDKDPCLESAHRIAMRIHAAMGNRANIERQYQNCIQSLWEEIGAPPSEQTQQLHEQLMK